MNGATARSKTHYCAGVIEERPLPYPARSCLLGGGTEGVGARTITQGSPASKASYRNLTPDPKTIKIPDSTI
jgi:hypothetical protein